MSDEPLPIACSLGAAEAAGQAEEWTEFAKSATSVEALPTGARLRFRLDVADSVADLARREAACCAFLDIDLRTTDGGLILEVTSTDPDALPVISALTGVAGP